MFVEKLTKKDLKELFNKLICKKYNYAKVEEIDDDFLKNNGLEKDKEYSQMPECFKNIKDVKNGKYFYGYSLDNIQQKDGFLLASFSGLFFDDVSWVNGYFLGDGSYALLINDFNFKSFPYSLLDDNTQWQKYMYSKFGEEYLSALKSYLENNKNEKINNEIKDQNEQIKKIINEITK